MLDTTDNVLDVNIPVEVLLARMLGRYEPVWQTAQPIEPAV
jgi:hypothetical protein